MPPQRTQMRTKCFLQLPMEVTLNQTKGALHAFAYTSRHGAAMPLEFLPHGTSWESQRRAIGKAGVDTLLPY
ncbi:MAG: hypothetical protein RJB05_1432 [Armatimonadota bacterium]